MSTCTDTIEDAGWEKKDIDQKRASCAGHTDVGSITFLYANPIKSLQVNTADGWRFVPYLLDSNFVNAGQCLEELTYGRYPAALHRGTSLHSDDQ